MDAANGGPGQEVYYYKDIGGTKHELILGTTADGKPYEVHMKMDNGGSYVTDPDHPTTIDGHKVPAHNDLVVDHHAPPTLQDTDFVPPGSEVTHYTTTDTSGKKLEVYQYEEPGGKQYLGGAYILKFPFKTTPFYQGGFQSHFFATLAV